MLAKRKKLGIVQWQSLIHIATNLPANEEVLVANIEDAEIHVSSTNAGFCRSGAVSGNQLSTTDLAAILESFLLCQRDGVAS